MIKALLTSGLSSLIGMALGAAVTKVIAVLGGPSGLGVFAQLRQISQWLVVFATLNGQNSIIRNSISAGDALRSQFVYTVGVLFLVGSLLVSAAVVLLAPLIAASVFSSADPDLVLAVRCIAFVVILGAAASFVTGLINSMSEVIVLAAVQAAGSLAGLIAVYPVLSIKAGYAEYALLPASGFAAVVLIGGGWLFKRKERELSAIAKANFCKKSLNEHITYSVAVLITGLAGSGAVLVLRSIYIRHGGLSLGGIFDSAWTISMLYVTLLLSSYGTYYFPTLSQNRTDPEKVKECVTHVFCISTMVGTFLVSFVVMLKPAIVSILYSHQFLSSIGILKWMLIGDYLKITSFVFGMLLHVYADRRQLIISDLLFQAFLIGIVWCVIEYTIEAVGIAFVCVNALYLAYIWRYAIVKHGVQIPSRAVRAWVISFIVILAASAWRWEDATPAVFLPLLLWSVIMIAYFACITSSEERRAILRQIELAVPGKLR